MTDRCDVGPCRRPVEVWVTFAHDVRRYGYCGWHAFRRGRLRWKAWQVLDVDPVDEVDNPNAIG